MMYAIEMALSGMIHTYQVSWRFVRVPVGSRIFYSPHHPERLWGPPSLLSSGYLGLFSRGVKLTTHFQLVPRSRKGGSIHPLPQTSSWHSTELPEYRSNITFTFTSWFIFLWKLVFCPECVCLFEKARCGETAGKRDWENVKYHTVTFIIILL
jgi:hypothetical protein